VSGSFLGRTADGLKRVDKYAGSVTLIFLLRNAAATTRSDAGGRRTTRRRLAAICGLVVLYAAAGLWAWWVIARPGLDILEIEIDEDIALQTLLADYPAVENGTLKLTEAVIAYEEGVEALVNYVSDKLSGAMSGISLSPVELIIVLENKTQKTQLVTGVDLRVHAIAWLGDCLAFGTGLPILGEAQLVVCPWWSASELPRLAEH
jgi:hypothetical protein